MIFPWQQITGKHKLKHTHICTIQRARTLTRNSLLARCVCYTAVHTHPESKTGFFCFVSRLDFVCLSGIQLCAVLWSLGVVVFFAFLRLNWLQNRYEYIHVWAASISIEWKCKQSVRTIGKEPPHTKLGSQYQLNSKPIAFAMEKLFLSLHNFESSNGFCASSNTKDFMSNSATRHTWTSG